MPVLVIDIGSSSVRAQLFDETAQPVQGARAAMTHVFSTDHEGAAVCDANTLRTAVEQCLDTLCAHPASTGIRAVGMATFVGNLLGINRDSQPLTPVFTYADSRGADLLTALRASFDPDTILQRTGCRPHTAYWPARLYWFRKTNPAAWAAVETWLDFAAWLMRCWFGAAVCSYSTASWSGMLMRETLRWDSAWCAWLGIPPEKLPPLADFDATQRGLLPAYAARWPALRNVPFYLALGDGAAANIGSGAGGADRIALTIGTTAALRRVSTENLPHVPDGLWSYRIDAAHHLLGGATSEGGNVFAWARETLRLPSDAALENALAGIQADSHGLTVLPLLAGERSPGWATDAVGTIHGLRMATSPLEIAHAALEAVALRLALIADQLTDSNESSGPESPPVAAGGGALTASPAWAQIVCNALNRPLALLDETEVTARGVAVMLLGHLDGRTPGAETYPPRVRTVLRPQPAQTTRLLAARERQVRLYRRLYGSG